MNEKELYKRMVLAQYEYFKFLEVKNAPEVFEFIKDKFRNPLLFGFPEAADREPCTKEDPHVCQVKEDRPNDKHLTKKLQLFFHPNKNPDRIDEATRIFAWIQSRIENDDLETLVKISQSADMWSEARLQMESDFKRMEKYCAEFQTSLLYNTTFKSEYYKSLDEMAAIYQSRIRDTFHPFYFVKLASSKTPRSATCHQYYEAYHQEHAMLQAAVVRPQSVPEWESLYKRAIDNRIQFEHFQNARKRCDQPHALELYAFFKPVQEYTELYRVKIRETIDPRYTFVPRDYEFSNAHHVEVSKIIQECEVPELSIPELETLYRRALKCVTQVRHLLGAKDYRTIVDEIPGASFWE